MTQHGARFTKHAIEEMDADRLTRDDVKTVVATGDVIADYPDDRPFPSRLVLGFIGGAPVHVVYAMAPDGIIIITAYRPDPAIWNESFRGKRS